MARLKSESTRYITIQESDYLHVIENTVIVEAFKIAGIDKMPIYQANETHIRR